MRCASPPCSKVIDPARATGEAHLPSTPALGGVQRQQRTSPQVPLWKRLALVLSWQSYLFYQSLAPLSRAPRRSRGRWCPRNPRELLLSLLTCFACSTVWGTLMMVEYAYDREHLLPQIRWWTVPLRTAQQCQYALTVARLPVDLWIFHLRLCCSLSCKHVRKQSRMA